MENMKSGGLSCIYIYIYIYACFVSNPNFFQPSRDP